MVEFVRVAMPQLSSNDPSATIVDWLRSSGQFVSKGEVICSAETSKSIFDIECAATGYLTIVAPTGTAVQVGESIAVITDEPVVEEDIQAWLASQMSAVSNPVWHRNWTYKAEILARRHGIDVGEISGSGDKITEADVLAYLKTSAKRLNDSGKTRDVMDDLYPSGRIQRLLIVGGGEGAIQVLDAVAKVSHQRAVAIVDDDVSLHGKTVCGVPVLGDVKTKRVEELYKRGEFDAAIISVSTGIEFRSRVFEDWRAHGIPFANVIHPSAVVGSNVSLGEGNIVLAFCHIGPCATIGNNNFLSAYCSMEHHSIIGDHSSFGPGVVTSSGVKIGDRVRFGTGIFIEPHITIGVRSVIGSGCVIWKDVAERSVLKSRLNYAERRQSE